MTKIVLANKEYEMIEQYIPQDKLLFYPENPRIYSKLNLSSGEIPEQSDIEEQLKSMDHVKQLKLSIQKNGGLIDPVIVKGGDLVVLEGNSRLAAYRLLAKNDPVKWGEIKCRVLPADIDEAAIFALLGQYHIVGRKDWEPFEQAGYLYRRHQQTKFPIESMAQELGLTKHDAEQLIETYQLMVDNNDLVPRKWSYYIEYVKSQSIKKVRKANPEIDNVILKQIKDEDIKDARDIRKIGDMAKQKDKKSKAIFQKVISGEKDLYEAYEVMKNNGNFDDVLVKLKKMRETLSKENFQDQVIRNDSKDEIKFVLKRISKEIDKLTAKLENENNG